MTTDEVQRVIDSLTDWWMEVARQEIQAAAPKAVEYGSRDLVEVGRAMASIAEREGSMNDEEAAELGIYFLVINKVARWTAALRTGQRVSDDTLLDIGIYLRMAQRNRAVGGWPFDPNSDPEGLIS